MARNKKKSRGLFTRANVKQKVKDLEMLSRGMIKIVIRFGAFGEKNPIKYSKKNFLNFQICHNQFLYFKTQPVGAWKL